MQKRHSLEVIIGHWQRNCWTEMCRCILWNSLLFGKDRKSLWCYGVTHYQWHYVVQMGQVKEDNYHHCCVMYTIYRWPKSLPPSNRHRVLCMRCLGKFTELCRWYGVTCTHGNCSSDTLGGMSRICWTPWHCIQHTENICMQVRPKLHRVGTQQESCSEMRNLCLSRSFDIPMACHDCRLS